MHEAEEQDTCRICSAPAEPDQPLFHPCKCSGTIRYIHQDCLTTWLAHSKKKTCDVCKHPYSFTKVYANDMPSTLPPVLLIRRLIQHFLFGVLFVFRAIAVAIIWLAVLPWVTVWTWRMYFSMGESTALWISDQPRPILEDTPTLYQKVPYEPVIPPPKTLLARLTTHPTWVTLSADIFTGQIIASLIVLTFVAVFLLREWISQNARPGVFEDEEPLPEDPLPVEVPEVDLLAPVVRMEGDLLVPVRMDELPNRLLQVPPREPVPAIQEAHGSDVEAAAMNETENLEGNDWNRDQDADQPARHRRRIHSLDDEDDEGEEDGEGSSSLTYERRMQRRRLRANRAANAARRRMFPLQSTPSPSSSPGPLILPDENENFEFTFTTPPVPSTSTSAFRDGSPHHIDRLQPRRSLSEPLWSPKYSTEFNTGSASQRSSFKFPPVPSEAASPSPSPNSFSFNLEQPPLLIPIESPKPSLTTSASSSLRRPQLPSTTFNINGSRVVSPLGSPSLATYCAPEELELETWPSEDGYFHDEERGDSQYDQQEEGERVNGGGGLEKSRRLGKAKEEGDEMGEVRGEITDIPIDIEEEGDDTDFGIESEFQRYFADEVEFEVEGEENAQEAKDDHGPGQHVLTDSSDSDSDEDDEDEEVGDAHRNFAAHGMFDDAEEEEEEEEEDGLFDDDGQWEAVELEDGEEILGQEGFPDAFVNAEGGAGNGVRDGNNEGLELNEEGDGNVEDDMEGAMEAIGMRGAIYVVFQNAALMIFVLDTAIGLGIWIPFTIGKSTALLSLNPQRLIRILHLPIRGMRIVTDPIVDSAAFVLTRFLLPPFFHILKWILRVSMFIAFTFLRKVFGKGTADGVSHFSSKLYSQSVDLINKPLAQLSVWTHPAAVENVLPTADTAADILFPEYLKWAEPYFATFGREVRLNFTKSKEAWIRMALGSGPSEKTFAILLGYVVVGLFVALYLNLLTVGNAKTAGRAVRSAVRQQLLVIKVASFIFIELVTFPLGCGVVLDLCTVWLFPEANLQARAVFFFQAPLTATFYHWVAGTMFMYTFAVILSGCRSILRQGAMWFIKDPQDANSHPIRDILDRPTLLQLRKIFVSGILYSFVVACVVGSVAGLLVLGNKSIMPFRWKNREPLSNVPIDLLFLHLVLPHTMHYFRPKRAMKNLTTVVWKYLAKKLRLTSYFFGGRHSEEERTPNHWTKWLSPASEETSTPDGSFRRVPATDNVALPRDFRATADVTEDGKPLDDASARVMQIQDGEAEKAKRNIRDDYMIVYIPPHFRQRVISFIAFLWVIGAISLGVMVALPIQLGRSFFKLFTSRELHDGYSLIVGFYLLWGCYLVGKAIDKLDKRRQRARVATDAPRGDLRVLVIKRGLVWVAKVLYMGFFLGIVIPILVAFVVDLYIILPIRFSLDPSMTPRIRVVDTWALGLLYGKIALHAVRIQPPNRITRGFQHITMNGWIRPDPVTATKEVIGPLSGGLLGMILLPGAVFRTLQYLLPQMPVDNKFVFMVVYPSIFMFAGLIRSSVVLYSLLSSWSQAIRDKEFLVELRLRNHDPDKVDMTLEDEGVVGVEVPQ